MWVIKYHQIPCIPASGKSLYEPKTTPDDSKSQLAHLISLNTGWDSVLLKNALTSISSFHKKTQSYLTWEGGEREGHSTVYNDCRHDLDL